MKWVLNLILFNSTEYSIDQIVAFIEELNGQINDTIPKVEKFKRSSEEYIYHDFFIYTVFPYVCLNVYVKLQ